MNHVINELKKAQKYRLRQLEESINKIKFHEEAIEILKQGIEQDREALTQIGEAIETLEKGFFDQEETTEKNIDVVSIPQKGVL